VGFYPKILIYKDLEYINFLYVFLFFCRDGLKKQGLEGLLKVGGGGMVGGIPLRAISQADLTLPERTVDQTIKDSWVNSGEEFRLRSLRLTSPETLCRD